MLRQAQHDASPWLSRLIGVSGCPSPAGRGHGVDFFSFGSKCIASPLGGHRTRSVASGRRERGLFVAHLMIPLSSKNSTGSLSLPCSHISE